MGGSLDIEVSNFQFRYMDSNLRFQGIFKQREQFEACVDPFSHQLGSEISIQERPTFNFAIVAC